MINIVAQWKKTNFLSWEKVISVIFNQGEEHSQIKIDIDDSKGPCDH